MKMHGYIYKTIGFFSRAQGHNALKPVAIAIAAATGSAADTGLRQQATGNEQQVAGGQHGGGWCCDAAMVPPLV